MPTSTREILRHLPPQTAGVIGSLRGPDQKEELASLGHDLKSPLTALKCCLSLVLSEDAGVLNPEQKQFLQRALLQTDTMHRMVDNLLATPNPVESLERVQAMDTDVAEIARGVVATALAAHPADGRTVDLEGLPRHLRAHCDPIMVSRILGNLVGNALKHTPAECRIHLTTDKIPVRLRPWAHQMAALARTTLNECHLVVVDEGPGMDPQLQARAFAAYQRGPIRGNSPVPGSGLGLTIARRLARVQGGDLEMVSGMDRGTTIALRLPADAATGHFLRSGAHLEKMRAAMLPDHPDAAIGFLDLRDSPLDQVLAKARVQRFLRDARSLTGAGCEPLPGLVAAAVANPRALQRRWRLATSSWGDDWATREWLFMTAKTSTSAEQGRWHDR